MSNKIKIDGLHFKMLMSIADIEFEYWETKNKAHKEKQCFNTINACRIGILSEAALKVHLLHKYGERIVNLNCFGITERIKSKHFYEQSDISLETHSESFKYEVKGITKGQPRGQILVKNGYDYLKAGISHVVFCEVDYNINKQEALIDIYLFDETSNVVKYPVRKNKYNVDCYTNDNYLHMIKVNK